MLMLSSYQAQLCLECIYKKIEWSSIVCISFLFHYASIVAYLLCLDGGMCVWRSPFFGVSCKTNIILLTWEKSAPHHFWRSVS